MLLRERVGMDRLRAASAARNEHLPRGHGHLAILDASMSHLRQFAPDVLKAVRFAGGPGTGALLAAVSILTGLYATGSRKVPAGAPVGFMPARYAGYLAASAEAGDVTGYRHYWAAVENAAGSVLGTPVATTGRATKKENHHDDSADGPRERRRRRP